MKIVRSILFLTLASAIMSFATSIDDVVSAMKLGDASLMSRHFDNRVEITLQEKTHTYSRSQAEMILRDFFSGSGVRQFRIMHRGATSDAEYCVGSLATANGNYRTTIYMKFKGDRKLLQELRFERNSP